MRRKTYGVPRIDLTGNRYGKLEVLRVVPVDANRGQGCRWVCRCDCGRETEARGKDLKRPGNTSSCGCGQQSGLRAQATRQASLLTPLRSRQSTIMLALADAGGSLRVEHLPVSDRYRRKAVERLAARALVRDVGGTVTLTQPGQWAIPDLRERCNIEQAGVVTRS